MNYTDMLTDLISSKKATVGGGTGVLLTFIPTTMQHLGMSGDPIVVQVLLGTLGVCYMLAQGIADHGKEVQRLQALRDFAGAMVAKGETPERVIALVKQMDQTIKEIEAPPVEKPDFTEAERAAFVNLLRYGNREGQPKAQVEGATVAFPTPEDKKPA